MDKETCRSTDRYLEGERTTVTMPSRCADIQIEREIEIYREIERGGGGGQTNAEREISTSRWTN